MANKNFQRKDAQTKRKQSNTAIKYDFLSMAISATHSQPASQCSLLCILVCPCSFVPLKMETFDITQKLPQNLGHYICNFGFIAMRLFCSVHIVSHVTIFRFLMSIFIRQHCSDSNRLKTNCVHSISLFFILPNKIVEKYNSVEKYFFADSVKK